MKKIYLSALALSIGTLSFGQYAKQNANSVRTDAYESIKPIKQAPNNKGAVYYTDDFSNAALWTMTGGSPTDWTIGQSAGGAGGFPLADLVSTSGAPFALFDSDNVNTGGVQDAVIQLIAPINCSAGTFISIQFENYYRPFNTTKAYVEVSNDGTNWTQYQVHANVAANAGTANPETTIVNVSATAGNQATVYIRFRYTGDWDYGWAIDDVSVVETEANDLVAFNAYYGTANVPYTRIPEAQIQAIDFAMEANNVGAVDQTGTVLTASVNGTVVGTSAAVTIAAGTSDSLAIVGAYTPPASTWGIDYVVSLDISSTATDATPGNNKITFMPFQTNEFIYAQDDYGVNGTGNGGGEDGNNAGAFEFEAGNYYDIYANADVYGIDVMLGSAANAPANEELDVVLYSVDANGDFLEVDRSQSYLTTGADAGTLINFRFDAAVPVTAGISYFAALHVVGNTDYSYATSGTSATNTQAGGTTSLIFYPSMSAPATGGNYYTSRTPMIRLSFDPNTVGINDVANNSVSFNVYPNPSTGEFNVNLTKDMGNVANLTVKNVVGQTVLDKQVTINGNQTETISLNNFGKGIYFLTINNETVKLIVE